jgi:serine/threonine protein kinase
MADLIGQSLGRYHILDQLGEGGMATVYKAYDTRLETDVAVKVIRTENLTLGTMERTLKRFEREAKALARLTHPNIVKVTDYGEYEGKPYLVMPYLPGGTLKEKLGKPIAWRAVVRFLLPIAHALEYAHRQNIIHRDIKPSNILLTTQGQPTLSDFGVAKLFDMEETTNLTGTGMGVGTPEYMAPEQWQGKVSLQSDVYSLGVVLYEMVTGRRPYIADTPAALLLKQANDPLPRPKSIVPNLPNTVERVLLKALAKNLQDRYQDMATFANALEGLLAEKQLIPESSAPLKTAPAQRTANTLHLQPQKAHNLSSSQKKIIILLTIGVALMLAITGVGIGMTAFPNPSPAPIRQTLETPSVINTMTCTNTPLLSTEVPTNTSLPTIIKTVSPSDSPVPTYTQYPTYTPYPSNTPHPTSTRTRRPKATPVEVSVTIITPGQWSYQGLPGPIISVDGDSLWIDMSAYDRPPATGRILSQSKIEVTFYPGAVTITGKLVGPNRIEWSNGTVWEKTQ